MGLTKNEQTEALRHLLTEDYEAYGRLIEDLQSVSQAKKIDLLFQGLKVAGLRVNFSPSDERVKSARDDLSQAITGGAEVVPFRRIRAAGAADEEAEDE